WAPAPSLSLWKQRKTRQPCGWRVDGPKSEGLPVEGEAQILCPGGGARIRGLHLAVVVIELDLDVDLARDRAVGQRQSREDVAPLERGQLGGGVAAVTEAVRRNGRCQGAAGRAVAPQCRRTCLVEETDAEGTGHTPIRVEAVDVVG